MERAGNILSAVFNSLDDVWFFVSPDYRIMYFNQKAFTNGKQFHGKELRVGDSILDYARDTQNNVDARFVANFQRAILGETLRVDDEIIYNSTSIWSRSKYTPVYENDLLLGISIIVEDITLQKTFETEKQRQQEEILKLSNKREEFINIASHELKTPLTSLKASLQILSKVIGENDGSQVIKTFLEKSNQSVDKLNNLIRSLLDANKVTSGVLSLEKSVFNIASLVDSCCFHVRMEGKYLIKVEGDLNLEVCADREKIDQVVVNLINNAVKYAPDSFTIIVNIKRESECARVSVQDFGPGITPFALDNLFKKYFQEGKNKDNYSGMGLGLYISEGIIKQHHGNMGVETTVGEGSTFWFRIPLE